MLSTLLAGDVDGGTVLIQDVNAADLANNFVAFGLPTLLFIALDIGFLRRIKFKWHLIPPWLATLPHITEYPYVA
jgi:hypothetical protein